MRVRRTTLSGLRLGIARGVRLRLAALGACLLLLATVLPVASFAQDGGSSNQRAAGPPRGTPIPLFVDGQQIARLAVGDMLTFVLSGDDDDDAAGASPFDKLVLLELAVQNTSAAPFRFDPFAVALIDDDGASYRALPDLRISRALSDDGILGDDDIPAGATERGWVGYAIPQASQPTVAVFQDDDDRTSTVPVADLTVAPVAADDDDNGVLDDDDIFGADDDDGLGDDDDGLAGNDDDDGFGGGSGAAIDDDDDFGGGSVGGGSVDDDDGGFDDDDGGAPAPDPAPVWSGDDDDGGGGDDDD